MAGGKEQRRLPRPPHLPARGNTGTYQRNARNLLREIEIVIWPLRRLIPRGSKVWPLPYTLK